MSNRRPRKPPPPLDPASLNDLALAYVGRFATTRAKLASYLGRKLRERGWHDEFAPDIDALVSRFDSAGLVDDEAYALAKAASLGRRGYGRRRVGLALKSAGIDEDDGRSAIAESRERAVETALRFAERRRLGPFAAEAPTDRRDRDRALGAMLRAGHDMGLSLAILRLAPGEIPDPDDLVGATDRHPDQ